MDEDRYARYGGFRREEGQPFLAQFGYGGAGFGGFGRKGKYGGYRSYYDYSRPMRHYYDTTGNYPPINMASIHPTWHKPTFIFAAFVISMLLLGLWFGRRQSYYYY
jgi:hypothetical protein